MENEAAKGRKMKQLVLIALRTFVKHCNISQPNCDNIFNKAVRTIFPHYQKCRFVSQFHLRNHAQSCFQICFSNSAPPSNFPTTISLHVASLHLSTGNLCLHLSTGNLWYYSRLGSIPQQKEVTVMSHFSEY